MKSGVSTSLGRLFAPSVRPQNSCYGLMVAALSDSVVCKVKSCLLQLI